MKAFRPGRDPRLVAFLITADGGCQCCCIGEGAILSQFGQAHREPGRDAAFRWVAKPGEVGSIHGTRLPFAGQLRVERQGAGKTDHVNASVCYGVGRLLQRFETAGEHERLFGQGARTLCKIKEVWPAARAVRGGLGAGEIGSAADVDQVDRRLVECGNNQERLVSGESTFELI